MGKWKRTSPINQQSNKGNNLSDTWSSLSSFPHLENMNKCYELRIVHGDLPKTMSVVSYATIPVESKSQKE